MIDACDFVSARRNGRPINVNLGATFTYAHDEAVYTWNIGTSLPSALTRRLQHVSRA